MGRLRLMLAALLVLCSACRQVVEPRVSRPETDPTQEYEALLGRVVSEDGLVDYALLAEERAALDAYVAWISRRRGRVARENVQQAFWLNAYNALALYAVLEADIPASILDVAGWLPGRGSGFYAEQAFIVHGERVSLAEILHERLRGRVMDLRVHAAVNGAVAGGPPLSPELFRMVGIDKQLRGRMQAWIRDEVRGVRVDGDRVMLSELFRWYEHDFAYFSAGDDPCRVAARFSEGPKARRLLQLSDRGCPRVYIPFDWGLNDQGNP